MDVGTIASGCAELNATIALLSDQICVFLRQVRSARKHLQSLTRELAALKLCLTLLHDDVHDPATSYPGTLEQPLIEVFVNCDAVLQQLIELVERVSMQADIPGYWKSHGESKMQGLYSQLKDHKSAIDVAVDIASVSLVANQEQDASDPESTTTALRILDDSEMTSQAENTNAEVPRLIAEISKLKFEMSLHERRSSGPNTVLQRFLDQSTSYADSIKFGRDSVVNHENMIRERKKSLSVISQAAPTRRPDLDHELVEAVVNCTNPEGKFENEDSIDRIYQLIDMGADPNKKLYRQRGNILHMAALNGENSLIDLLLEHGADIDAVAGNRGTALQTAVYVGHGATVDLLLEKGANVNIQGGNRGNAIQAASTRGHQGVHGRIFELLIRKGADVNAKGGYFHCPLHAASFHGHKLTVQRLLDSGASIDTISELSGTALCVAAQQEEKETVEILLNRGADFNLCGGDCGTALQAAVTTGNRAITELLLKSGADVNVKGGRHGTALRAACHYGDVAIVSLLLRYGAVVHTEMSTSGTALHVAAAKGHLNVVRMLLEKGADINARCQRHGTALQAAKAAGRNDVAKYLTKKMLSVDAEGRPWSLAIDWKLSPPAK